MLVNIAHGSVSFIFLLLVFYKQGIAGKDETNQAKENSPRFYASQFSQVNGRRTGFFVGRHSIQER